MQVSTTALQAQGGGGLLPVGSDMAEVLAVAVLRKFRLSSI
jgi:hypothetical protein